MERLTLALLGARRVREVPFRLGPVDRNRVQQTTVRLLGETKACGAVANSLFVENPRNSALFLEAVKSRARSWLTAWVRAFIAERRTALNARISTRPSPLLDFPAVSQQASAARAASASNESDLLLRRRDGASASRPPPPPRSPRPLSGR